MGVYPQVMYSSDESKLGVPEWAREFIREKTKDLVEAQTLKAAIEQLDDWKEDAQKLADWALEVYSTTEDRDLKKGIGEDIIAHYALVKKYTQV